MPLIVAKTTKKLFFMAEELVNAKDEIIEANKIDLIN